MFGVGVTGTDVREGIACGIVVANGVVSDAVSVGVAGRQLVMTRKWIMDKKTNGLRLFLCLFILRS
jgi:hypothetical protein